MDGRAPSAGTALQLSNGIVLRRAESRDDLRTFADLTREYYDWLAVDLCFQGIEDELASLPGCYAPPGGCIIIAARAPAAAGNGAASGSAATAAGAAPLEPLGCVAVRPLSKEGAPESDSSTSDGNGGGGGGANGSSKSGAGGACEMKRLWVRDAGRGTGVGRALVAAAVDAARGMGYRSMVLDTLERLEAANAIYESSGFRRRDAYYHNPLDKVVYWERDL